jgi:hypothetical protein
MEYHIKNSADFIQRLKCTTAKQTDILISFNVVSLFSKVPLKETLQLLEQQFEGRILYLFRQMLTSTYFVFDGKFCDQKDGITVGSPLAPIVANYCMENFEKTSSEHGPQKAIILI